MSRANDLSVEGWRPLFDRCADAADTVRPDLRDTIAKELDVLEARWPKDLPSGVIHADLFPDNVFFLGTQCSGLIDFYFACTDSFAYSRRRPVSREELEALPILCRGAAMRFLLTRLYDWVNTPEGAMVKRKDPGEYLHKLVFHQQVPNAAAYGLDPADVA
jgi:homoserine kinase type II